MAEASFRQHPRPPRPPQISDTPAAAVVLIPHLPNPTFGCLTPPPGPDPPPPQTVSGARRPLQRRGLLGEASVCVRALFLRTNVWTDSWEGGGAGGRAGGREGGASREPSRGEEGASGLALFFDARQVLHCVCFREGHGRGGGRHRGETHGAHALPAPPSPVTSSSGAVIHSFRPSLLDSFIHSYQPFSDSVCYADSPPRPSQGLCFCLFCSSALHPYSHPTPPHQPGSPTPRGCEPLGWNISGLRFRCGRMEKTYLVTCGLRGGSKRQMESDNR